MATSSFLKNVELKDKNSVRRFVCALENAEKFQRLPAGYSKSVEFVQKENIKKIFGEEVVDEGL